MDFSADRFIWCTRGRKWGFRLLSFGGLPADNADAIYRAVFADDERAFLETGFWEGRLFNRVGEYFLAARVFETACRRVDEHGRKIPHELLFIGNEEEISLLKYTDWTQCFLNAASFWYSKVYNIEDVVSIDKPPSFRIISNRLQSTPHKYMHIEDIVFENVDCSDISGGIINAILDFLLNIFGIKRRKRSV